VRVACVAIPSFAVAIERLARPQLARRPAIVSDRTKVFDASPDLIASVPPGSSLRQAKARHPEAVCLEADHARYRAAFEAMLDALQTVSPLIEPARPGVAYVDTQGLHGLYRDEFALAGALVDAVFDATGLRAAAGIGEGKFVAWTAASLSAPGDAGIVQPAGERAFLHNADVSLLPVDPEVVRRLELLALRTLGDIAALPKPAVEAEFRRLGARLWELANGIDREPLRPRTHQELLRRRLDFNGPVVDTKALTEGGNELLAQLTRRLRSRTARQIHVQLLADERIVWERTKTFREPTGDPERMLLVVKTLLSLLELQQAVDAVAITLAGIGWEVAKQTKLFAEARPDGAPLAEAIEDLRTRFGRPMVYHIVEVNPSSRLPEERTALVPIDR